jgi:hypothetical protein
MLVNRESGVFLIESKVNIAVKVSSKGVEPISSEPESDILSIELRRLKLVKKMMCPRRESNRSVEPPYRQNHWGSRTV